MAVSVETAYVLVIASPGSWAILIFALASSSATPDAAPLSQFRMKAEGDIKDRITSVLDALGAPEPFYFVLVFVSALYFAVCAAVLVLYFVAFALEGACLGSEHHDDKV
jgi:hypothetical protein